MIKTQKIKTSFMVGNTTPDVFEIMSEKYDWSELCNHHIDYDQAIFSDGFIAAMERGQMPILGSEKETWSGHSHGKQEYHHLIWEGVCYDVYFTEEDE